MNSEVSDEKCHIFSKFFGTRAKWFRLTKNSNCLVGSFGYSKEHSSASWILHKSRTLLPGPSWAFLIEYNSVRQKSTKKASWAIGLVGLPYQSLVWLFLAHFSSLFSSSNALTKAWNPAWILNVRSKLRRLLDRWRLLGCYTVTHDRVIIWAHNSDNRCGRRI